MSVPTYIPLTFVCETCHQLNQEDFAKPGFVRRRIEFNNLRDAVAHANDHTVVPSIRPHDLILGMANGSHR